MGDAEGVWWLWRERGFITWGTGPGDVLYTLKGHIEIRRNEKEPVMERSGGRSFQKREPQEQRS